MSETITRRRLLASTPAVAAAVALPAVADASTGGVPTVDEIRAAFRKVDPATHRFLRALLNDDCDHELRQLYVEYQHLDRLATEAWRANLQLRNDLERSVLGGKTVEELCDERRNVDTPRLSEEENAAWMRALEERPRPDFYDEACALGNQVRSVIERIRAVPAEGLFGIAVKLVVLAAHWQGEDVEENARFALTDINSLTGAGFTLGGMSLDEYFEEWRSKGDEDDEDDEEEAGGGQCLATSSASPPSGRRARKPTGRKS